MRSEIAMPKLWNSIKKFNIVRVVVGTATFCVSSLFAFSVANADLPPFEHSVDPNQQAIDQIMMMMTLEKAALAGLGTDRLAEMSGISVVRPSTVDLSSRSVSLENIGSHSEEDAKHFALIKSGQDSHQDLAASVAKDVQFNFDVLDEMPSATGDTEWQCLREALYFEARSETLAGQLAVGEVILNRVDSDSFPDSVCGVVQQGAHRLNACQFSYNCDGKSEHFSEPKALARAGKIARMMLDGTARVLTSGATYYHATSVNPSWARVFNKTAQIGRHAFYSPS